jgi:hypothetical protein
MSAQNKKVVILDSLQSKKIITQLVQGDYARAELKIYKKMDSVSTERIKVLVRSNFNLLKAFEEKQLELDNYKLAFDNQEKIIRREKNKKSFYKITSFVGLGVIGFLILN